MKLKHIHIDHYKLFDDFDIDFCVEDVPLPIVLIAGVNGTGKSTLLDYIRPKRWANKQTGEICIVNEGGEQVFQVPPTLVQDSEYQEFFSSILYFGTDNITQASGQLEKEVLKYVDRFVYVEGKTSFEAYGKIQALLDTVFADFHLQVRFKGLDADRHLRFVNQDGAEFGVNELSDGEKQLLMKVFPLFMGDMKGHVILMDEPDGSLHPSWQSYLLPILRRCAEEKDSQFILATHSPQIISSAYQNEIRLLTRDADGFIRAKYCKDGPYGWTVEKVLDEIQHVPVRRVPEVEGRLDNLHKAIRENRYETEAFKEELKNMESLLGYSDPDLTLIRMEILRRRKNENYEKSK